MAETWHIGRANKERYGPYSLAQLKEFARTGQLQPTDMLLLDGSQRWIPSTTVSGLFPAQPATVVTEKADTPETSPLKAVPAANRISWANKWTLGGSIVAAVLTGIVTVALIAGVKHNPTNDPRAAQPKLAVQALETDLAKMQGVWECSFANAERFAVIVEDDSVLLFVGYGDEQRVAKLVLSPNTSPKQFELRLPDPATPKQQEPLQGLYQLDGNRLKVAGFARPRPTAFTEENTWIFVWKGKAVTLVPTDPTYIRGLKTWNYWHRLAAINKRGKVLEGETKTAKTPEQVSAGLRRAISLLKQLRSDITDLPVLDVDREATSYAAELVDIVAQAESLFGDFAAFLLDAKEFREDAESLGTGLEAFIRGFLGDPLGTYNELNAQTQQLEKRRLKLVDRWKAIEEKGKRSDAQELSIRASLSQKYNREFPKLD